MSKEEPIIIPIESVKRILVDNISEILKDTLTSYSSPVKKLFTDEKGEIYQALKKVSEDVVRDIITSPDFQEGLKNRLMQTAVENIIRGRN